MRERERERILIENSCARKKKKTEWKEGQDKIKCKFYLNPM